MPTNINNNNINFDQQITTTSGSHDCTVLINKNNNGCCYIVDRFSSITSPLSMTLYKLEKTSMPLSSTQSSSSLYYTSKLQYVIKIYDSQEIDVRFQKPHYRQSLITPILQVIRSDDDTVDLFCAIYLPPGHHYSNSNNIIINNNTNISNNSNIHISSSSSSSSRNINSTNYPPHAAIISVYGGPHVQRVTNNWLLTVDLRAQCLAQAGFVVIKCDNRGSYRRGIEFEGALYLDMGNIEVIYKACMYLSNIFIHLSSLFILFISIYHIHLFIIFIYHVYLS
jgi:hypothetical protein